MFIQLKTVSLLFILYSAPLLFAAPSSHRPNSNSFQNSPFSDAWSSNWGNNHPRSSPSSNSNDDIDCPDPTSTTARNGRFQGRFARNQVHHSSLNSQHQSWNNQAAMVRSTYGGGSPPNFGENDDFNWGDHPDNGGWDNNDGWDNNGGWDNNDGWDNNGEWDNNHDGWNPPPNNNNDDFNWDDPSQDGWDNDWDNEGGDFMVQGASLGSRRNGGGGGNGNGAGSRPRPGTRDFPNPRPSSRFTSRTHQSSNNSFAAQEGNRRSIRGWFDSETNPEDCDEFGNPINNEAAPRRRSPRPLPAQSNSGNNRGFFERIDSRNSQQSNKRTFDARSEERNFSF